MEIVFDVEDHGDDLAINATVACGVRISPIAVVLEANSPAPVIYFPKPIGFSAAITAIQQAKAAIAIRGKQLPDQIEMPPCPA